VVRSKGFFWLATRMNEVGSWSQAGGVCNHERAGFWWASAPQDAWPVTPEAHAEIQKNWEEPFGDRRQELVLIGMDMDEAALRSRFDDCLLTDEEMRLGPAGWAAFEDPLPTWESAPEEAEEPAAPGDSDA
jgi:G3E family GTPase